jgi:hypothetical protein
VPQKPKPTKVNHGRVVPNPNATAANGALHERSAARMHYALQAELEDIEAGNPTKGRYVRVRDAIIARFNCSRSEAERAIARGKIYLAERFDAELPAHRADVCRQLQRIADDQEQQHPIAAVAALREKSKILGLYAPKKLQVTHGAAPELALQLDAILAVLSPRGHAAMDVLMEEIEAAKREGRLALPEPAEAEGGAEDAEFVEVSERDEPDGAN